MGQQYSAEEKREFQEYQKIVIAAIKDKEPYEKFRKGSQQILGDLKSGRP